MATIRIVLRQKKNKDETFPLAIRITKDRRSTFITIGQNVIERDWDADKQRVKKSHPNSARLNYFIMKKLAEANDKLLEFETQTEGVTSKTIGNSIKPKISGTSFFTYADNYLDNFKTAGKYNRFHPDQSRIRKFREFLDFGDIDFKEITVPLLVKFKAWLKGKHKSADRSVVNHLIIIRTIFNLGIKGGVIDTKHYPFGKEKIQIKLPDSLKTGLTREEVKRIEELEIDRDSYTNHCRNMWLFSFYFAGMRVSDVLRLRWKDVQDDRLNYQMGKNSKTGSLKASEKALAILKQYQSDKKGINDLIFPELKKISDFENTFEVQRKISYAVKRIDKHLNKIATLASIEKKLTMHISRHTFGNISGDSISIQMLQKLYRHSSITTTIGYQANFIHKDADDALDAVLDF